MNVHQLLDRLDELMTEVVAEHLISDVPLGAFLSGGIDSSLVVAYAARLADEPLKTFSVRFAEAGFDESPAARAVADKYGTEHHVLDAPEMDIDTLTGAITVEFPGRERLVFQPRELRPAGGCDCS